MEPSSDLPELPIVFQENELAKRCWQFLCGELTKIGLLSSNFAVEMELYCVCYVNYRRSQKILDGEGHALIDTQHGPKRNPAAVDAVQWITLLRKLNAELCLTPTAMAQVLRLSVDEPLEVKPNKPSNHPLADIENEDDLKDGLI